MLRRTTHYQFQPYGDVLYRMPEEVSSDNGFSETGIRIDTKKFTLAYYSEEPVFIQCKSGIALLAVSNDGVKFERFVIHRNIKLRPGQYFNFVAISDETEVLLYYIRQAFHDRPIPEPFIYEPGISKIRIDEILTTYYQVRKENYNFPGEAHNYFELVYIDHGSLQMTVDGQDYSLNKYDLMLYYPGQYHSHYVRPGENCSYLTVIFRMTDTIDPDFKNRVFHTRKDIYQVLCNFMKAVQTEDYLNQELAILYLKEVIILLHQFDFKEVEDVGTNPMQEHYENTLLNEILVYINNNIYSAFTVEDLCSKFAISRSSLQNLFRANLQISPKQYISSLKLNQAKILIQQHSRTVSEISDMLGFTSIHYFSRKFKMQYGMSPTDYSKSIHS